MKHSLIAIICSTLVMPFAFATVAHAQQKTVKACQEEWRGNKAANQAAKITEKSYVEKCRAGDSTGAPTATPAAAPAPAPARTTTAAPTSVPSGANQYTAEAQAKARCPSDTVVWVNLKSKIYHFAGKKDYGNTKSGTYMCEKDATSSGMRAAKNEKHP